MDDNFTSAEVPIVQEKASCTYRIIGWLKIRYRYLIVALLTLGQFLGAILIISTSLAVIAMAAPLPEAIVVKVNSSSSYGCAAVRENTTDSKTLTGTLDWSQEKRTLLVNAVEWGLLIVIIPMGRLSEYGNPKRIITVSLLIASILCALIPVTANWNIDVLIVLHVALGGAISATYPSFIRVISKWVAEQELNTMVAINSTGGTLSSILCPLYVIAMCLNGYAGGWPSVFYTSALATVVWLIIWQLLVTGDPLQNRFITNAERDYILQNRLVSSEKKLPLPWIKMLTSLPVCALGLATFSTQWPNMLLVYLLPSYMNFPLNISLKQVGYLNAAIYAGSGILVIICGVLEDFLKARCVGKDTILKKIIAIVGGTTSALCITLIPFSGCNEVLVTIFSVFVLGATYSTLNSLKTTAMKMAPNFSGTLYSALEVCISLSSPLVALMVTVVTGEEASLRTWSTVFYISAVVTIVGPFVFLFLGSAEIQQWATKDYPKNSAQELETMNTAEKI